MQVVYQQVVSSPWKLAPQLVAGGRCGECLLVAMVVHPHSPAGDECSGTHYDWQALSTRKQKTI